MVINNVDDDVMMTTTTNNNTKQTTNKKRVMVTILTNCILLEASYNGATFSTEINISFENSPVENEITLYSDQNKTI